MKLLSLVVFILFCNCSMRHTTRERFIEIGSGGGFTGVDSKYRLMESGMLYFSSSLTDSFSYIGKMNKELTKTFFDNYDVMNFHSVDLDHPGNRYFYIDYSDGEDQHKIVWTDEFNHSVENLSLFYNISMWRIKNFKNSISRK